MTLWCDTWVHAVEFPIRASALEVRCRNCVGIHSLIIETKLAIARFAGNMMSAAIFISYRRSDTAGHAKNVHDHLAQWFDEDNLFFDSQHINPGDCFPKRLADAIDGAKVMLVLVGPDWVNEINRRAELPEPDFVRVEVERGMQHQTQTGEPKVIPVLLGLMEPPSSSALHPSLRAGIAPLLSLDFHIFQGKNSDWNNQFARLRDLIAAQPGAPVPRFRAPELDQQRSADPERRDSVDKQVLVRSRPPFVVDEFRDRSTQRRRLRELVKGPALLCVIVSGRAGIGKTALLSQFLIGLEAEPPVPMEFVYFSAAGSVPVSEDLLRAYLTLPSESKPGAAAQPPDMPSRPFRRLVIVLDQAELLLDAAGAWCAPGIEELLRTIRLFPNVMLVLGTRILPSVDSLTGYRIEYVPIDEGLPQEDARALLSAADFDGRLGLRADLQAADRIIEKVAGNPRMLELASAILQEDPLLTPASLALSMASYSDVVQTLLRDSYASVTSAEKALLMFLAVAARPMPLPLLRGCLPEAPVEPAVRSLSKRHLVRVDRESQSVHIAPLDAEFLLGAMWTPEDIRQCHVLLAEKAGAQIRVGLFKGRMEDLWRLKVVEHFIRGGEHGKASDELARSQQAGLEAHGLYDQLIRLHEQLAGMESNGLRRRGSALLRLFTLAGRKEKTVALLRQLTDAAPLGFGDDAGASRLALEMGAALRDLDRPRDGLRQLHRAAHSSEPDIAATALAAIAQILRRRGDLVRASRMLERALTILDRQGAKLENGSGVRALILHQQALIARFTGRAELAGLLLEDAIRASEAAQDAGGLAYRYSLRAALDSDALALRNAIASLSKAMAIYDEIGDDWGKASALYASAQIQSDLGDDRAALDLATKARGFARSSGNTRADCLLDGLSLTLARRSDAIDPAARRAAGRAAARLDAVGMRLYARRVRYELALDRCLAGEWPMHDLIASLPTVAGAGEVGGTSGRLAALRLLRPLGSRLSADSKVGAGMARDAEILSRLLTDASGGASPL